jgi:8-oxo-dGTP pyrophosphatase MutT (NUDIX family)
MIPIKEYRYTKEWPYHISCGGVVYRSEVNGLEVLLLVGHDGSYDIPKGTLRHGETLEACALREVEEESGQRAEIMGYLGSRLDKGVLNNGAEIAKTTHYFAMNWILDTGIQDDEYDHFEWVTPHEAQAILRPSRAEIVGRFLKFTDLPSK